MTCDLAAAALAYAERGVRVFPLTPGTKVPLKGSHGLLDASVDPDVVCAWWATNPDANIGAATGAASGFFVLDVDAQHDGLTTLARLEADHDTVPVTVTAATPSGGYHHYFRNPGGGPEIRNSTSRIGPGLDIRGEGGSIVMPPSRLSDGRVYRWVANGAQGFADATDWLIRATLPPPPAARKSTPARPYPSRSDAQCERYVAKAVVDELRELQSATSGTRNDTLNRVAFALAGFVRAGALPEDWTRQQLEDRSVAIGLSVIEARRTIESAFKSAQPRELP